MSTLHEASFADVVAESRDHLNDEHDDTVAFMAQVLCGVDPDAGVELAAIEPHGLTFRVRSDGSAEHRVDFAQVAASPGDAYREFLALLGEARHRAAEAPLTSLERASSRATIPTHVTTVTGVRDVSARIREITVRGGLERFTALAPDQFVYVLAPPHGRSALTIDESFTWERYEQLPQEDRPVGAYYTVRRWRPDDRSLDLWVVLHGHDGDGERWARQATVGSPVALWGPRRAYDPPDDTDSFLLIGDETALPAMAAILEQLAPSARATVLVAAEPGAERIELSSPAAVEQHWLAIDAAEPGRFSTRMIEAIGALGLALDPTTYVWGGAESHEISTIRRHVRRRLGHPRERGSLTGYWRRA